jgi:hypothetical protein
VAYNRSPAGKLKRKLQNGKRGKSPPETPLGDAPPSGKPKGDEHSREGSDRPQATPAGDDQPPSGKPSCEKQPEKRADRSGATPAGEEEPPSGKPKSDEELGREAARAAPGQIQLEVAVVEYLRVVVSLIEGRKVSRDEVLEIFRRRMRQRSLARERRIDYVVRTLKEKPP